MKSSISKNLILAIAGVVIALVSAMPGFAQVELPSRIILQGTALVTKKSNDQTPSNEASKSGGLLVGYSYQFSRWFEAEGDYGYSRNTQNFVTIGGPSSVQTSVEGLVRTVKRLYASRNLTFDVHVPADLIGDSTAYLQENMECMIALFNGVPITIELPQRVTLEIVETEPVIKNQTAASSFKPALLSNGVRTAVPPHVATGTRVVISTDDGSYVERAKD